jgi:hypothetical protein
MSGPLPLLPGGPAPLFPAGPPPGAAVAPAAPEVRLDASGLAALKEIEDREQSGAIRAAEQKRLEAEHGAGATTATHFTRGLLDVVMAPAALAGMAIEGAGELTGVDVLRDFGRDFGSGASGRELMSAYMSGAGMLNRTTGLPDEGLSDFERTQRDMREQEEAWPMLSAVSHVGGQIAGGVAIGGLAAGHAGLGTTAAASAVEGGAFGAQAGYAKNASLRDVATSALIGAAVSGGLTYGIGKGAQVLKARNQRAADLREALGPADDAAARAGITVEEAGGREAQSVYGALKNARDSALKAADGVDNGTVREQVLAQALNDQNALLAKKVGDFDPTSWVNKPPNALQKFFKRSEILDKVADDTTAAVAKVAEHRPSLDVGLDVARLARLTKNTADAPAAIGTIQTRVGQLMAQLPKSAEGDVLRFTLRDASSRLMKADLPNAMKDAHELVRALGKASLNATDEATKSFAERAATSLADDMAGEAFGDAGKLYGQLLAGPSKGFTSIGNRELMREALRTMQSRGQLPDLVRGEATAIALANDAAAKLTGQAAPKGIHAELRAAEALMAKAEAAVTLDGGPAGRVFDWFKDKASDKVSGVIGTAVGGAIGGLPGAMAGNMVANAVKPKIGVVLQLLKTVGKKELPHTVKHVAKDTFVEKTRHAAFDSYLGGHGPKHASLTQKEKHEQYAAREELLQEVASSTEHEGLADGVQAIDRLAPGLGGLASADAQEKLANLSRDLIRPQPNIRGKSHEVLSNEDLRKNNAMWEATVDPLSVYEDLASGALDYDKLNYTWKQYPGLLEASQMALVDIVHSHLDDDERANVPEHILSQIDLAFQMQGGLTKSLDRGFSKRMDMAGQQIAQQQQQKPQPQGQLNLPGAKPTPVQRIAGTV